MRWSSDFVLFGLPILSIVGWFLLKRMIYQVSFNIRKGINDANKIKHIDENE